MICAGAWSQEQYQFFEHTTDFCPTELERSFTVTEKHGLKFIPILKVGKGLNRARRLFWANSKSEAVMTAWELGEMLVSEEREAFVESLGAMYDLGSNCLAPATIEGSHYVFSVSRNAVGELKIAAIQVSDEKVDQLQSWWESGAVSRAEWGDWTIETADNALDAGQALLATGVSNASAAGEAVSDFAQNDAAPYLEDKFGEASEATGEAIDWVSQAASQMFDDASCLWNDCAEESESFLD